MPRCSKTDCQEMLTGRRLKYCSRKCQMNHYNQTVLKAYKEGLAVRAARVEQIESAIAHANGANGGALSIGIRGLNGAEVLINFPANHSPNPLPTLLQLALGVGAL